MHSVRCTPASPWSPGSTGAAAESQCRPTCAFHTRSLQPPAQVEPIPHGAQQSDEVDQTTRAMQVEEALIQPFHLRAVGTSIIALLAVAGLLMLALAHGLGCLRTQVHKVRKGTNEID